MIIDKEFKQLIPPLSPDEYKQLEENILNEGVRDAVVFWDNNGDHILIDGHNRWEIAQKHNIPINQRRMEFPNREAVIEWIILNQFGRRNLSKYDRSILALKLKPVIAEKAKENVLASQNNSAASAHQKSDKQINTNKELAKVAGVSHDTIHRVEKIKEKGDPELIDALRKGEVSINEAYLEIVEGERETERQKEARELNEAKERSKVFANNKVVSIGEVKQDAKDNQLIFGEFEEKLRKAIMAALKVAIEFDDEVIQKAVKAADRRDLIKMQDDLQEWYRTILKLQRKIVEVIEDEK